MNNLFETNKYTNCYFKIIEKAKSEIRIKTNERYFEKHHIVPRSLGGDNSKSNLVLLTAKEHFICHLLLTRMAKTGDHKRSLAWAYLGMTASNKHQKNRITNNQYSFFRGRLSQQLKGKEFTSETRTKMSLNNGQRPGSGNSFYGKQHSEETKKKISDKKQGQLKNSYHIYKDCKNKIILESDCHILDYYIFNGWKTGRYLTPAVIEKIKANSRIKKGPITGDRLEALRKQNIANGLARRGIPNNTIWIRLDENTIKIKKDKFCLYEAEGWVKGRASRCKTK